MSENRTTSAGYRFPIGSRPNSSEFHQTCIPAESRPKPPAAPTQTAPAKGGALKDADFSDCDQVTQDEIWKQTVATETKGVKQWNETWGFLTEYDAKGRPKSPKELPSKVNMFASSLPNTNSGNYGSRLNTELGQNMQQMEFQFNTGHRKKKLGGDLVCY